MGMDNSEGSLTELEKQVLIGCLMGDATMRKKKNSLIEFNHSFKQRILVDHLYGIFCRFVLTPPSARAGNGWRIAYRFTTRSLAVFNYFYDWFFPNGKKLIPLNLKLTPRVLAYWIMDDGNKSYRAMYLNTQKYKKVDQQRLIEKLEAMGIHASLNKDKIYWRIRISTFSVPKLKRLVWPYLLPQFYYKFP
jgi:hypothetical protein